MSDECKTCGLGCNTIVAIERCGTIREVPIDQPCFYRDEVRKPELSVIEGDNEQPDPPSEDDLLIRILVLLQQHAALVRVQADQLDSLHQAVTDMIEAEHIMTNTIEDQGKEIERLREWLNRFHPFRP